MAAPEPNAPLSPHPEGQVYTVSALTRDIRKALEGRFPSVWVRGEISNFRRQASGHCYFSLKDSASQLTAVLFRGEAESLSFAPRDGLEVLAYGRLGVYEPRGTYQLVVRTLLESGAGRLQAEFERRKQALAAEGLFDPERKSPLPRFAQTIGIVTSPTGAALRDVLSVLRRGEWRGRVILLPTRVQGEGAAAEIAAALRRAGRHPELDLVLVTRGGGSIEDLWPFNEEVAVRALAACPRATLAAIGHQIDTTLCDFAADQSAETPSAAAAWLAENQRDLRERTARAARAFVRRTGDLLAVRENELRAATAFLRRHDPRLRLEASAQRLDELDLRRHRACQGRLDTGRDHLVQTTRRLRGGLANRLSQSRQRLGFLVALLRAPTLAARREGAAKHLANLTVRLRAAAESALRARGVRTDALARRWKQTGPEATLRRGFVYLEREGGDIASRRGDLAPGERVTAHFADGTRDLRAEGGKTPRKRARKTTKEPRAEETWLPFPDEEA